MKTITELKDEYIVENFILDLLKKLWNILFSNSEVAFNTANDIFDDIFDKDSDESKQYKDASEKMSNADNSNDIKTIMDKIIKYTNEKTDIDKNKKATVIMSGLMLGINKFKEIKDDNNANKCIKQLEDLKGKYKDSFDHICKVAKENAKETEQANNNSNKNSTNNEKTKQDLKSLISDISKKIGFDNDKLGSIYDVIAMIKNPIKNESLNEARKKLKNLTLQQKFKNDEIISTLRKKLENDKDNKLLSALITMLMSFSIMKNKIDNIEPYKILNMISYLNKLVEKTESEKK